MRVSFGLALTFPALHWIESAARRLKKMAYQSSIVIDSDDEENETCFGMYRGTIVGIRYYGGTVCNNEMVSLRREPNNPYDRNAVRVDNVDGVQVGHIKREQARVLTDVVDGKLARIEG